MTILSITTKGRARLEQEQAEAAKLEELARIIAAELEPQLVAPITRYSQHTPYAEAFISLDVPTLPEALEQAERLNPLCLYRIKRGCTKFCTEDYFKDGDEEHAEAIGGYIYKVEKTASYPTEKQLRFFVMIEGRTLEIRLNVKDDPLTDIYNHPVRDGRGRIVHYDCGITNKSGHFTHSVKYWASYGQPNPFVLY